MTAATVTEPTYRRLIAVPTLVLTPEDHNLIHRAQAAFRDDYRYLEQVLWQARARRPTIE